MTTNLIGLIGFAMVGKDTAAANMPGWTRFAFADRIKRDTGWFLDEIGCRVQEPTHKAMARELFVVWGNLARIFKPDYWIEHSFDVPDGITDALETGADVVITDVRYSNECERILAEGGRLVLITRPRYGPANATEAKSIAEILERWPAIPTIKNTGTKEELGRAVLEAIG